MSAPILLDYNTPEPRRPPEAALLRVVLWCGLVPLGIGVSIFLLWVVTRARMFPMLGFIWLGIGTLIVGIGGLLLLGYVVEALRRGMPRRRVLGRAAILLLVLLINFPVAGIVIRLVNWIDPNVAP